MANCGFCKVPIPKGDNFCSDECYEKKRPRIFGQPTYKKLVAQRRTNTKRKEQIRHCYWCAQPFSGSTGVYCSGACRQAGFRANKANGAAKPALLKLRFDILERDGFRCRYCGRAGEDVVLQIDHVQPQSKGGSYTADNLMTSCRECNLGKGDRILNHRVTVRNGTKELGLGDP